MSDAVPAPGAVADLMTLPTTPAQQAQAKIIELKANPDWVKRHVDGSVETKAELQKLHELASQPEQGAIISGTVTPEMQWAETAAHLETVGDLPPAVIEEIRQGKPASAQEYRLAVARKNTLMKDPTWVARYLNNGAAEQKEMLLLNSIVARGMRLA
jgi:hypothetical protein